MDAGAEIEVTRLRWRATQLRDAARRIRTVPVEELVWRAGADTWRGPVADGFVDDASRARRACDMAATVADSLARRLDALAAQIREEQVRAGLRS